MQVDASAASIPSSAEGSSSPSPVESFEPKIEKRIRRYAIGLLVLILLLYGGLGGRLIYLQYHRHPASLAATERQLHGEVEWKGPRGTVVDTAGRVLAASVRVSSCAIDPTELRRRGQDLEITLRKLHKILHLTPQEVGRILRYAKREGSRFVWIRRRIPETSAAAIRELRIPGVILRTEYLRRYPQREIASHCLGFTDIDEKGIEGIERICDAVLRGLPGHRTVMLDARRRPLISIAEALQESRPGLEIELTLDTVIQLIAEEELARAIETYKAIGGIALVMDPATGDLLAMANRPTYDPNAPASAPTSHRLNQAIAAVFEPGSTFKPIVFAAALEAGAITPSTIFHCEHGRWNMDGRILRDVHSYGELSAAMVLIKSSNIGTVKIAAKLGRSRLYEAIRHFGFGEPTGIPLPGEVKGKVYPLSKWTKYSMGSVPIGQEVAVTPIQLATAYAVFANGGTLVRPRLIRAVRDREGKVVVEVPVEVRRERVISPETARIIRELLHRVVLEGTGTRAKLEEYPIGGKTGTAQLPVNTAEYRAGHRGYSPTRYLSSFVAIAPYDVPRLVVLVSIREPKDAHYGGTVAAPAVKEIVRRTLKYLGVPESPPSSPVAARQEFSLTP